MSAFLGKISKSFSNMMGSGTPNEEVKSGASSGKASTAESQEREGMSELAFILSLTEEEKKADRAINPNVDADEKE